MIDETTIETNEPYYDHREDGIIVFRDTDDDNLITADIPRHRTDFENTVASARLERDFVREKIRAGVFEQAREDQLRQYATSTELQYFLDRDEFSVGTDAAPPSNDRGEYESTASKLNGFDGVSVEVEFDKSYSPNLRVTATGAGGQSSDVFQLLADRFDVERDIIGLTPTTLGDRDAVMFRVKAGGM